MKDDIIVSVIIPAYNSEKTIERCLRSVCNQDLREIEILVIDDGSIDNTAEIVLKLALADDRVKYVKKDNGGVSSARNCGLEMARGRYIAFADSDDYVLPNTYTAMLKYMNDDVDLVISGFKVADSGVTKDVYPSKDAVECSDWKDFFSETFTHYLWNTPWNKLFRRDRVTHKFDHNKHLGEDLKFILEYISVGRRVRYCQELLYVNDLSNENSLSKNWLNKIIEEQENHLIIGNFIEKHGISYDAALSDYFISALWVTAGKAVISGIHKKQIFEFSHLSTNMKAQILKYKPQKIVNKGALAVLKINNSVLNYMVLTSLGLLSEYKNRRG